MIMRSFLRFSVVLLLLSLISGCITGKRGSGEVTVDERRPGSFDRIEVGGAFDIYLRQGPEHEVSVVTDDNLQDVVELRIENGELIIETDGFISEFTELKVFITLPVLRGIELSGACDLEGKNTFTGDHLDIELSGSCNADLAVDLRSLDIDCSGACTLFLSGGARKMEVDLSGSCDLKAFPLTTDICRIDVSGASDAEIAVMTELVADASGASNITYLGDPKTLQIDSSGASDVQQAKR